MGSHSLPPGDLPDPGIEPGSPALQTDSLQSEPHRSELIAYLISVLHSSEFFLLIQQQFIQ